MTLPRTIRSDHFQAIIFSIVGPFTFILTHLEKLINRLWQEMNT
jgi:hypothetical protein